MLVSPVTTMSQIDAFLAAVTMALAEFAPWMHAA